jgi:hypothetical protein
MASTIWLGQAPNKKQIATAVVTGTWAQNDTATFTINGLDFVITIGTLVTTAQVATTIQQAFSGTTLTDTSASCQPTITAGGARAIPAYRELTATVSSSTVSFTATATSGVTNAHTHPFTMTSAVSTAGDGDITYTNAATAHDSRHEADNADNWSAGAALADNDAVYFSSGSADILDGLSLACQPASITKHKAYTGKIGRGFINNYNSNPVYHYPEYRTKYLTTDDNSITQIINLEVGEGQGSGRVMLDTGAGQVLLNLFGQGTPEIAGVPCVIWKGSHASNEVNNANGDLGVAFFGGETATISALQHGNGPQSIAKTICSSGVTLTTVTINGGTISTDSAITTVTQLNGTWTHGLGTVTTANIDGGTMYPMKNATITTLRVGSNGRFDTTRGTDPFTITNTVQLYAGAVFYDPQGRTGNTVFKLNRCKPEDVTIVIPDDKTLTLS